MTSRLLALLALFTLAHAPAGAQSPADFAALEEELAAIVAEHGVVGASVAVSDRDGPVFARGFALADREAGLAASGTTPMRAGSVSKLVTALAAMRLAEAGRLDLEAPLAEIAPDVAFTNRWEEEHPVRLVHLIEHTTGWDDIQLQEYRSFPAGTSLAEGLADNPGSRTSRYPPGLYHAYANSGPAVLGRVIELETGLAFEEAAERLVFDPLGLETASFEQDEAGSALATYDRAGGRAAFTRIWAAPSGALSIGAADLAAIGRMLLNDGAASSGRFLGAAAVARMEAGRASLAGRAGVPHYGLGLYESRDETGVWHGHAGAIDSGQAELFYNRETGLAYALMVNTAGPAMEEMRAAIRRHLGPGAQSPAVAAGWRFPEEAAGTYRIVNPRQEMIRAVMDLFEPVRVTDCGDALCLARGPGAGPVRYRPMGGGRYFREDAPQTRLALIDGPHGLTLVYEDGEAFARTSGWRMTGPLVLWIAVLAALLAAIVSLLVWCAARPFGGFEGSHRWRVWLWPSLSVLALGTGLGALMAGVSGDVLANFAGPSLTGRLIQLGTLIFGPLAAAGVWAALRAPGVSRFARIQAGSTSALLLAAWAWMALYGWAGLTPWRYAPNVFG